MRIGGIQKKERKDVLRQNIANHYFYDEFKDTEVETLTYRKSFSSMNFNFKMEMVFTNWGEGSLKGRILIM